MTRKITLGTIYKSEKEGHVKLITLLLTLNSIFILSISRGILYAADDNVNNLLKTGYEKLAQGDFAAAIKYFNKVISIDPKNSHAYVGLASVSSQKGDFAAAIESFNKAVLIDPQNSNAYVGLGNASSQKGDPAAAIKYFNKAISIDPKNSYAYVGLGNASSQKGDPAAAIKSFNKAISIDPKNSQAYVSLYNLYASKKDANSMLKKEETLKQLEKINKSLADKISESKAK